MHLILAQAASSPYPELANVTGIIAATLLVVQVLKRVLGGVPFAQHVPTWCYAVGVAVILTVVARYGLHALAGDIGPLLWQAFLAAATAGGFQTWIQKPGASPKTNADNSGKPKSSITTIKPPKIQTMLLLSALVGGALALQGCAPTATARWYQAQDSLNTARNSIVTQWRAGNISDTTLIKMDVYEKAIRDALKEAKPMLDDPAKAKDFDLLMDVVERALDKLIAALKNPSPIQSPVTPQPQGTNHGTSGNSSLSAPSESHAFYRPSIAGLHRATGRLA